MLMAGACLSGGMLHANDSPTDNPTAFKMYRKACDLGSMDGCNNLGDLYETGRGTVVNYKFAVMLYQQACEGRSATGCYSLSTMYERGLGVEKDTLRASKYRASACELGYQDACRK